MNSLKIQCENEDCPWQGELVSLTQHLDGCDYTLVPCPNECDIEYVAKKDLELHLESECLRREYECPYCEEEGEYEEMTTTHLEECPDFEIECPNFGCEDEIPRCEVSTHRSTCDYEPVSCKYAEVGCEERPLRKDLKKHEGDDQFHLQVISACVLRQQKELTYLKNVNRRCTPYTLKVANFKRKKSSNAMLYSSPFYTSPTGYKMCIQLYVNGYSIGKGTHISVFACLMKGDNDGSLTWPFTGTVVTFELLNQLEDKNHHRKSVTFPADDTYSARVVHGDRRAGWGVPQFISHKDIDFQLAKNCQYLKNDTLVIRVDAKMSDYKPWLECSLDSL